MSGDIHSLNVLVGPFLLFLVLQSFRWVRDSLLFYLNCLHASICLLVFCVSFCRCAWEDPDGGWTVGPDLL